MKILLHGLNYAPEEIGIGKYSGEMVRELAEQGHEVVVVTTPPYYPQWEIAEGFSGRWYRRESQRIEGEPGVGSRDLGDREGAEVLHNANPPLQFASLSTPCSPLPTPHSQLPAPPPPIKVIRCPLYVPGKVTGLKRIVHLASFGLSSIPAVFWTAMRFRPDVIMTVEPAAFCMPTTWLAARLCGAKAWLHVQDFEVDAAFELGILKQPLLKRLVLAAEAFLMRRFDRVSSISPNMLLKLVQKGVAEQRVVSFPNWVDCDVMKPIPAGPELRARFGIPADRCVALYAGNIGNKQGLEIVIEAARRSADRQDLHFVICGRGAAYESLLDSAEGLSNVQFLPLQPMERFNELMNCADIHLLPQRADAADLVMPSKLTGMLATGRPIVACASPGTQIADVVNGHGIVVRPADGVAFWNAIIRLTSDQPLRESMGRKARDYAVERLGRRSILNQFIAALNALSGFDHKASRSKGVTTSECGIRVDSAGAIHQPVGLRKMAEESAPEGAATQG
ncbi:Alpha-D-kanosaminyltransferase [Stieleria maiorica]|uniref:Alpha-D-kanosaminyltransferase n=1 Tax=Stieleria maiorica TaxID=2795974 RepID=A0A5B9MQ35_9BACT|nr:glycosyltransferase WbuB [Stieleria maiorica]QEG01058.1 Alpha-D-kanosaminyltransferase [Stieleria maiorica]